MRDWIILPCSQALWDKQKNTKDRATIERCLSAAALAHGVSVAAILSSDRRRPYVCARWDAMAAMRDAGLSLPTIGRVFKRDHTSVMHGLRQRSHFLNRRDDKSLAYRFRGEHLKNAQPMERA